MVIDQVHGRSIDENEEYRVLLKARNFENILAKAEYNY